jgi:hypothetical protein
MRAARTFVAVLATSTLAGIVLPTPLAQAGSGPDAYIAGLWDFKQFGRVGSVVGCMGDSEVCNAGNEPIDWDGPPGELHPFMVFSMYRLKDGRLQQIGQSSAKHSLNASQNEFCKFSCDPFPNSTALGPGCSDTYSVNFNGNSQPFMGPRAEINPWTGEWNYIGSHIATPHTHDGIAHRVQINDNDLSAALNPGATYMGEIYVVAHDDLDPWNSSTWSIFNVSGSPGGTWTFSTEEVLPALGPVVLSWPEASFTTFPDVMVDDGQAVLATKITDNGNGTWHYEYAVYNHNMDRGIASFTLPIAASVNVTNIGFYAIPSHDEPWSSTTWTNIRSGSTLSWSTQTYAENEFANAIHWGSMYNFWFDANAAPGELIASFATHKPGKVNSFDVTAQGPIGVAILGDITGNGIVDVDDLLAVINAWGPCAAPPATCPADIAPLGPPQGNGVVDVDDLLTVINHWTG